MFLWRCLPTLIDTIKQNFEYVIVAILKFTRVSGKIDINLETIINTSYLQTIYNVEFT